MLVCVWDGMNAAIPRIQAEQNLEMYAVLVASSPYADRSDSQRILDGWYEKIRAGFERAVRVSLKTLEAMLVDAFGPQVKSGKD